jgi:HAD superfamily hydrolase (TIGR01509 family)
MTQLKAILFDHDGTLVDSEPAHLRIWQSVLQMRGLELSEREYQKHFVGVPSTASAAAFIARRQLNIAAPVLNAAKEAATLTYLEQQAFPLMPGAQSAVAQAHALGLKCAVVTGAGPEGVQATLRHHGWGQSFDVTVSAADVAQSKPAPDVYLLALARLGLKAPEAVAIEDTATGVQSARAAGLICLAIPHAYSAHQDFSNATHIVASLAQAMNWIRAR